MSTRAGVGLSQAGDAVEAAREAARDDLKEMLARLASDPGHHAFGLYFNCAGNASSLYGLPGIDSAFTPHGVNQLFTYTGVLALFGEEPHDAR